MKRKPEYSARLINHAIGTLFPFSKISDMKPKTNT